MSGGAVDFGRYIWERSGRRTWQPRREQVFDPSLGERIASWVLSWTTPVLSICIPTKNRLDLLLPCLASLARTCGSEPVEVIIGDTGSDRETHRMYERLGLKPVQSPGSFNFSRVCNAMAKAAQGKVLVFLNNDTEAITAGWPIGLLRLPDNEIAGACLIYPGTRRIQHAGITVSRRRWWPQPHGYAPVAAGDHRHRFVLQSHALGQRVDSLPTRNVSVMAVSGAFLATTARRFRELGGFDEAFEVDLQDIDYCLRARAGGSEVTCRGDLVFVHHHAGTRGRYRFPHRDWQLFLDRWAVELDGRISPSE